MRVACRELVYHFLTQSISCFVPGPTPSPWQPSEPPGPCLSALSISAPALAAAVQYVLVI